MKRIILFFSILLVAASMQAQDIFKKHGYDRETLTLSKGRYKETFINENVMQIGTVLIDTRTDKVVQFLEEEATEIVYRAENMSRFLTPDPLAEKYPQLSPYVYCANNPVRYIDPNGMELTDYHNNKGELLYRTDDELDDVIIVTDANIPKLEEKLQEAKDNGTINDSETNKNELHTLGQTPEQYANQKTKGTGADWTAGYVSTYGPTYKGEKISFWDEVIHFIAGVSNEARMMEGGRSAGKIDGKRDRNEGKINRLDPRSSLKNNLPKIKLRDKNNK